MFYIDIFKNKLKKHQQIAATQNNVYFCANVNYRNFRGNNQFKIGKIQVYTMAKVVLITGGSSGIGKAIGDFLTQKGFTVVGTSRHPENYTNNLFELVKLDVKSVDSINRAVQQIIDKYQKIDVLINNAGVGITGPIEELDTTEMKNNFDTNFFGPIDMIKAILPQMRLQNAGLIINITSLAAYMGLPYRGIYSASKGALELVTEAISMEVKQFGINITNVAPGDFATNIAAGRYHAPIIENSVYQIAYKNTLNQMNSHVNSGENPIKIAQQIFRIINTKNPNIHYKVSSFMPKFSIVLKRILPDLVYQKMLMNHFKL